MKAIERRIRRLEAGSGLGSSAARQWDLLLRGEIEFSEEELSCLIEQLSDDELEQLIRILE